MELIPYEDGSFDLLHRPGCMTLGSSLVPALILPPEARPAWLPSIYAIGAHLLGKRPLPDADNAITRRGRWLEGAFQKALAEKHKICADPANGYVKHPRIPGCIASPDFLFDYGLRPLEAKTVSRRKREDWSDAPPLYPQLQIQWQLACHEQERGAIAPLFLSDYAAEIDFHLIDRHDRIIAALEEAAERFMEMLDRGELPEADASPSSYAALQDLVTVTKTTIQVPGSEALDRARKWRQAQADEKAAKAVIEAQKQWFAANANDAAIIALDDDTEISRAQRTRKAHECKESSYWSWKV